MRVRRARIAATAGRAVTAAAAALLLGCGARPVEGAAAAEREREAWERPAGAVVPRGLEVPLEVRETAGVGRRSEVAAGGVPLPRRLGLQSADGLAVVAADGRRVPAEMRVLARWPVPSGLGPVQWLWVAFPATVGPSASASYRLVAASGLPEASGARLLVTRGAEGITVDTGAARFVVRGDGALFAEVGLSGVAPLASGRPLAAVVDGNGVRRHRLRRLEVVRAGPMRAVVVAEAELDRPAVGGGAVVAWWRYELTAGSPTAVVREAVQWEGVLGCPGCVEHDGRPAGVRLDGVRDELVLARPAARALVFAERGAAPLEAAAPDGAPLLASLRQLQRRDRKEPPRFTAAAGDLRAAGQYADRALLAAGNESGVLAVATRGLHHYEPQGLTLDEAGVVRVALADGPAWLANHQGAFGTIAVAALPAETGADQLAAAVWAPLNRPLRPWPTAEWLVRERPIDEVPFGPLPAALRSYDEVIPRVLHVTQEAVEREGVDGLMTFGVYPRYWGEHGYAELDCGEGGDPTPGERWDDTFWCGAWTDYHHTAATSAIWAMRTGELEWLDELSYPAAQRTLHTQMMQCGPEDEWFYCAQAPTGYGAYRTDFNSSHAYFDNLLYYYRTSGDETVVERLRRGAASLSRWARGKHDVVMRAAAQWHAIGRFLGTVGERDMESYFRWGVETAIAEHYLELERDGERFGFWSLPPTPSGEAVHSNLYATAFYDFQNLYDAMRDTGNAPLGPERVEPSRALVNLARSYVHLAGTLEGAEGDIAGRWSRGFAVRFAPPRVGGRLLAVATEPGDPNLLYPGDKPAMAAFLMHAAQLSGDPELRRAADALLAYSLERVAAQPLPFGKIMGLGLHRVHPAVAAAASETVEGRPP